MVKKYLVVCWGNVSRSPIGEDVLKEIFKKRGFSVGNLDDSFSDVCIGSAGIDVSESNKPQSVQLTREMMRGVDLVFAMDEEVKVALRDRYNVTDSNTVCLNICNLNYNFYLEEDIERLRGDFRKVFGEYL